MENTGTDDRQPAAATSPTLADGSREPCRKAESLELGVMAIIIGAAVLLDCLTMRPSTKGADGGVRSTASLLLAFSTFLCGTALTLLNLARDLLSGNVRRDAVANCLAESCVSLLTLTSLALLWAFPCKTFFPYVVLAVAAVVTLVQRRYQQRRRGRPEGGNEAAAAFVHEQQKADLEDASRTTTAVTVVAAGYLIGAVSGVPELSGAAPAAVFFVFCTAIFGLFLMVLLTKVPGVDGQQRRRLTVRAIRSSNAVLLCFLALASRLCDA